MKLILVRHTSVAVEPGTCYGQTDVQLSASFPHEAEIVKERLKIYHPDLAYTSPLSRCRRLATFCGYPDATKDDRLMEMNFGAWEMQRYDSITDPHLQAWYDDYLNVPATDGESFMDQQSRFKSFVHDLNSRTGTNEVIAFTHGGILLHAMILYLGMTPDEAFAQQPSYGSILTLDL